jgi:uncharacterized protein (DUF2062 family)
VTLARSLATGVVLGICPVFGLPLLVSSWAILRFKLNAPLVASVQLTVGALALPIVVLLAHMGASLLGTVSDASPAALTAAMRSGPLAAARSLSTVILHALLAWLLVAPVVYTALLRAVTLTLSSRRTATKRRTKKEELLMPRKASTRLATRRTSPGTVP